MNRAFETRGSSFPCSWERARKAGRRIPLALLVALLAAGPVAFPGSAAWGKEEKKSEEKKESEFPGGAGKEKAECRVEVRTIPKGAFVFVDGVKAEDRTPVELMLPPGPHQLRLFLEGYQEETREVEAEPGRELKIRAVLRPLPEYARKERREGFQGGYVHAGMAWTRVGTSDLSLKQPLTGAKTEFRDEFREGTGLAFTLRYVHPLEDKAFLIVDTGYLDSRLSASNVRFKGSAEKEDIELALYRGMFEVSLGPNYIDYLLPYLGAGFHYSLLSDPQKKGWLGKDNQEDFTGYSVKAGLLYNNRSHLTLSAEYRWQWAYELEDSMFAAELGWRF